MARLGMTRLDMTSVAMTILSLVGGAATAADSQPAKTLVLTNVSGGKSFELTLGTMVEVKLSGGLKWSETEADVESGAQDVLMRLSATTSPDGSSDTTFLVAHFGSVGLSATGRAVCKPDQPCPLFLVRWGAFISVPVTQPPSPPAATPPSTGSEPPPSNLTTWLPPARANALQVLQ
jgi:hypothetical protein